MRLLPDHKTALERADMLSETIERYVKRQGVNDYSTIPIYWIVFLNTIMTFKWIALILISLFVLTSILNGFEAITLLLLAPVIILIYEAVKIAIKFTNEFVIKHDEDS